MQRDRARERMERAKRQWELEHASDTCIDGKNQRDYSILSGIIKIRNLILFVFLTTGCK